MGEACPSRGGQGITELEGGLETKFVYLATKGTNDPTLASIPFHLAVNGSVEVGHDAAVILVGDGTEIAIQGAAESINGVGVPPMSELLDKLKEHEVPVYV
jgi:predicted peroxiredoxin